jgi:hypothetical protein
LFDAGLTEACWNDTVRAGVLTEPVWSLFGHDIRLTWGFTTRVVIDGAITDIELPSRVGGREISLDGRSAHFRVGHVPGSRVLFIDLYSAGELVPPGTASATMDGPPPGARCAAHRDALAAGTCIRCGSFACAECCKTTGVHCATCLPLLQVDAPFVANQSNSVLAFATSVFAGVSLGALASRAAPDATFPLVCLGGAMGFALAWPLRRRVDAWAHRAGPRRAGVRRGLALGLSALLSLGVLVAATVHLH